VLNCVSNKLTFTRCDVSAVLHSREIVLFDPTTIVSMILDYKHTVIDIPRPSLFQDALIVIVIMFRV